MLPFRAPGTIIHLMQNTPQPVACQENVESEDHHQGLEGDYLCLALQILAIQGRPPQLLQLGT